MLYGLGTINLLASADQLGGLSLRGNKADLTHVVLDDCRSRKQTARFQDLFQPLSYAYLTGGANAGSARPATSRKSPLASMATSLSRPISDTAGCLI
jgi:hypothetical protein